MVARPLAEVTMLTASVSMIRVLDGVGRQLIAENPKLK
jgi:hypothetical protein